jgi:hypothetical protein
VWHPGSIRHEDKASQLDSKRQPEFDRKPDVDVSLTSTASLDSKPRQQALRRQEITGCLSVEYVQRVLHPLDVFELCSSSSDHSLLARREFEELEEQSLKSLKSRVWGAELQEQSLNSWAWQAELEEQIGAWRAELEHIQRV